MELLVGSMGIILGRFLVFLFALPVWTSHASILLITSSNSSFPFPDVEASFATSVPTAGVVGRLYVAEPLNACQSLLNTQKNGFPAFLLVERGGCDFVAKVKNVQDAGYAAAIVYNNEDDPDLISMSGSGKGINIYALFVSKKAGEALRVCAGDANSRCYLFPSFENTARSVMAISLLSLLTLFTVLSTLFFVRRHRYRLRNFGLLKRGTGGMKSKEVKALPTILFDAEVKSTMDTCTICLEEYTSGQKLRVLPCAHEFHVMCIDQWLTTRCAFCPICKQDVRSKSRQKSPNEYTPLLTSCGTEVYTACSVTASAQCCHIRSLVQNPATLAEREFHPCHISGFYGENSSCLSSTKGGESGTVEDSSASAVINVDHLYSSNQTSEGPSNPNDVTSCIEEEVIQVTSSER